MSRMTPLGLTFRYMNIVFPGKNIDELGNLLADEFAFRGPFHEFDRWFSLSREQFDSLHYAAMAVFKMGVLLFNLVPYLALRIVGWGI